MEVRVIEEECIGCAACVSVCPTRAIEFDDDSYKARVDADQCTGCEECVAVCAVDAIVPAEDAERPAAAAPQGTAPTVDRAAATASSLARDAGDNGDNGGNGGNGRPRWDTGRAWESPPTDGAADSFRLRDWRPGQGKLRSRIRRLLG